MKKLIEALALAAIAALFVPATALAQSSGGNFTASVDNTVCTINSANGSFNTGPAGSLTATIKLPGSLPGLLVTPSLVTGMYTNTGTSGLSQTAAIVVVVTDTLGSNTVTLTPNQTCVDTVGTGCTSPSATCQCGVVYDERFQQLTFMGGASFDKLVLSTLSAHSFNFTEGNVPGGIHTIKLNWYFGCDNGTGKLSTGACTTTFVPDTAAACAGPGTLTVTQVQQFQHSSQIGTTGTP